MPLLGRARCHASMVERSSRHAARWRGNDANQQVGMIVAAQHDRSGLVRSKPLARLRRAVTRRVSHPAIDLSFAPAGAVNADRYLRRECPFGDLAVDGRSRQSCAVKNGFKPDDPVWFCHVRHPIGWWSLTPPAMKLIVFSNEGRATSVERREAHKKRLAGALNCMASLDAIQAKG
jgi:hypothetical protein